MPDMIHVEKEDNPWAIDIPDHAERTESHEFVHAKDTAHKIMALVVKPWHGPGPWQMHHGGSLWVFTGGVWHLYLNVAGMEWSSQFCADPAKVEVLRQNAERLYAAFPDSEPELVKLGYKDCAILHTPITDQVGVGKYVDSIFNSCVPLAAAVHTGVLSAKNPTGGGEHHYPKPITDIQHFKLDTFTLWVTDAEGQLAAVTPVAGKGSGNGAVKVEYATPGTVLHQQHADAHAAGKRLVLPAGSDLAKQAFAQQQ